MKILSRAIDKIMERIENTANSLKENEFPIFADINTGKWTTFSEGYWSDGFWVGLLWLAYYESYDENYLKWAERWLKELEKRINLPTVFRGFIFYYGAAISDILLSNKNGRRIAIEGGKSLANQYDRVLKIIPLNKLEIAFLNSLNENEVTFVETNIDGVIASVLLAYLANVTGNETFEEMARNHAQRHLEFCINADGSVTQSVRLDPKSGRIIKRFNHMGFSDNSVWARGQAWAMLNYSLYSIYDREFLNVAKKTSDWWINNVAKDYVAFWDFHDATLKDTSSTAIAASAFLKLAELSNEEKYREFAKNTVISLVENYLTGIRENDTRSPGILTNGCYFKKRGIGVNSELIWGDYFLFESLLKLEGKLTKLI